VRIFGAHYEALKLRKVGYQMTVKLQLGKSSEHEDTLPLTVSYHGDGVTISNIENDGKYDSESFVYLSLEQWDKLLTFGAALKVGR
jgi:hypothetical protein